MGWIAFLPWLRLKSPVRVGRYELLPYEAEGESVDSTVQRILSPYWWRFDLPGRSSTLVQVNGQIVHDDEISDDDVNALFRFSE